MRISILLAFQLLYITAFSQTDFTSIDSFAQNAPKGIDKDSSTIAAYLLKGCHNDMEKARAAFTWIANNIMYDDNAYNTNKYADLSASTVLKNKHTVCDGYANLYVVLAKAMGLEAQKIEGYAKGYGYQAGDTFKVDAPDHSWNAVKVNKRWVLLDVTWGATGTTTIKGRLKTHKEFSPYWFNVDRYEFLFSHYPQNPARWLLIPQPITLQQYEEMPYLKEEFFQFGFNAHDIMDKALSKTLPAKLPTTYATKYHIKLINFPLYNPIAPTPEANFSVTCPEDVDIEFINDAANWIKAVKNGDTYSVKMPLKKGNLEIAVKGKGDTYKDFIEYKIK